MHRGRGRIIRYVELSDMPKNVFASVTLGSEVDSSNEAEVLEFLECNQLQQVKVRRSRIALPPDVEQPTPVKTAQEPNAAWTPA